MHLMSCCCCTRGLCMAAARCIGWGYHIEGYENLAVAEWCCCVAMLKCLQHQAGLFHGSISISKLLVRHTLLHVLRHVAAVPSRYICLQDNSYPQDRRTSPLPDMAKAEAKLADMVKHESKPAAEENGSGAHIKPEQGTEPGAQHAQQARGQDESYIASLAKPHGPSTHSNIAPPPAVQGPAAGISAQPPHPR